MSRLMLVFVLILLALGATATSARAAHAPHVHVIVVDKMQFGPMPTDVHVGDIIEWTNHDILEHSATAANGRFDIDLPPGASGRWTATAGTLDFVCKFHPTMSGKLVVK